MISFLFNLSTANWILTLFIFICIFTMITYILITIVKFILYFQIKKMKLENKEKIKAYSKIFKNK